MREVRWWQQRLQGTISGVVGEEPACKRCSLHVCAWEALRHIVCVDECTQPSCGGACEQDVLGLGQAESGFQMVQNELEIEMAVKVIAICVVGSVASHACMHV
eukprot:TRINITY_DN12195_c0_g1_i1.p8 TRINITY_DN12195_c0_g1~~TRINITY_DN12195_c0_g1_i1.p8  ORF type:complete len:103 (-),score=3.18 TRINITY_DN12195_c0_g1_i1:675-983(-)